MGKVVEIKHPLVQHKISVLRDVNTSSKDFRQIIGEIASLMTYEATRDLETELVEIETPICKCQTPKIAGKKLAVVPILRAGVGMVDGILAMIPSARVGFVGMYRNEETFEPVEYFCKLPVDIAERTAFVVDPMLATGGSAIAAINALKNRGVKNIRFLCTVAVPQGIEALQKAHPDVDIYIGVIDDHLNENAYIVPGLGDAGDRIFGTK